MLSGHRVVQQHPWGQGAGTTGIPRSAELSLTVQQADLVASNRAHQQSPEVLLSFRLGLELGLRFPSEVAGDRLEMNWAHLGDKILRVLGPG